MKNGWQTKALGDVCRFIDYRGKTPKKTESGLRLITAKNVKMGFLQTTPLEFVNPNTYKSWMTRGIPKRGDVLFTTEAPLANVAQLDTDEKVVFAQRIIVLQPSENNLNRTFLKYLLLSDLAQQRIHEMGTGATVKGIKASLLKTIPIEFPPLPEQQRIVGILDEAFEGIVTAKANAEDNLQNARAIFDSHLRVVFTQRGKRWAEKPFEELLESNVIGLTKSSREQGEKKEWPYVKMNNITRDNRFEFSSFTCVDATDEELRKYSLRDGDFLFNTRNSYELVGKSCIYESDSDDIVLFNNNIMRVRFKSGVDARFVLLAFCSEAVADELNALKSGTTNVSAIYFKDLKSLAIPVPPIEEQRTIAAKLESLVAETQRLESIYRQKLGALEALKKSLLHQAFTGEL